MKHIFSSLLAVTISLVAHDTERPVTIAILAKDKAHCLPTYLECIEKQTWPASQTYLYIRTNNNKDSTACILKEWVEKVKDRYPKIHFDDSDVPENLQQYGHHEWNSTRFKILGKIRSDSLSWAKEQGSHYLVVDCDNFIFPHTLETLLSTKLLLVAPLLYSRDAYSNYHPATDEYGYFRDSPYYLPILTRQLKGLIQVPVIHCTYLIRHEALADMCYDDNSGRHEYIIFSDTARKKDIPQYLDNRDVYGYLTFTESKTEFEKEPWLQDFTSRMATETQKLNS